ncbi:Alpha/Beta hydrolase protein [Amylocystis lapponica]|nr:Alpha/Beta hydrolase protein [Amylocystis lapponica]
MTKKRALYGTWPSPVVPDAVVGNGSTPEIFVDPVTSTIYHIESRAFEDGRMAIVNTKDGSDVMGSEWNARTGVHEYGGAPAIAYGGVVYFSNFTDNRVYAVKDGDEPRAITPDNRSHRFAKFAVHPVQTHLLVGILEDHTNPLPADVVTTLCVINSETKTVATLVSGADFYSAPCFSSDGTHFAWQQWFHPDMPWEGAEIYVADMNAEELSLSLSGITCVAGKRKDISAGYPIWASNDVLLFTSDISGFQNPWKYSVLARKSSPVLSTSMEFDFALPAWSLSLEWGAPLDLEGHLALFSVLKRGRSALYVVHLQSGTLEEIECPYVGASIIKRVTDGTVVFIGEKSTESKSIVLCTVSGYEKHRFSSLCTVEVAGAAAISRSFISIGQPIALRAPPHGDPLHVIYYPPTHPDYDGMPDEKPPCVVGIHGGPTGFTSQGLDWTKQFFTSRGWAWLDVNYGGSSGYGREYINRLAGKWGIVDVRDSVHAMQQLSMAPYSLIDAKRSAIRGGSAGGFTTLATACFAPQAFAAGTSSFGVSDLRRLAEETHKFESHYLFGLVGGTIEQIPKVWEARSPVFNTDKIQSPLLVRDIQSMQCRQILKIAQILQGSIDAVVPPAQAEDIVKSIRSRGGRVEYTVFEGEGHGWRKAETIKAAVLQEIAFYEDVFAIGSTKKNPNCTVQ